MATPAETHSLGVAHDDSGNDCCHGAGLDAAGAAHGCCGGHGPHGEHGADDHHCAQHGAQE